MKMITVCIGYGPVYKPARPAMQIPNMQNIAGQFSDIMNNVRITETAYNNAVHIPLFQNEPYSRQVIAALSASGASASVVKQARGHLNKMTGKRVSPRPTKAQAAAATTPLPKTISDATNRLRWSDWTLRQPGCRSGIGNRLCAQWTRTENGALQGKNCKNSSAPIMPLRKPKISVKTTACKRDQMLFKPETGMGAVFYDVKDYAKSVFGPSSKAVFTDQKAAF